MVKRPTLILLIILALAIGAYFLIKNRPLKSTESTPTALGSTFLVTEADGTLQSLRIDDDQGDVVQLQRDPSKVWVLAAPTPGEADQALRIVTTLETIPDLSTIKLDSPAYTIELKFDSGIQHKLEVGDLTPTGSGYYVRYDDGKVYVISQDGIDSLLNLLKSPPYPPTATPAATDTPTLTPTLEATTPTVTITPGTATPTPIRVLNFNPKKSILILY
jgi:hypothetical protein